MGSVPPLVDPFAHIKFDNSLGALLVGVIVSATLLGLTSLQSYLYYTNFPNDRTPTKILVGVLWLLDGLQVAFISHSAYYYLVTNYGNAPVLLQGEWSIIMEIAVTIVIAVSVQLFFAQRVFKVSRNNYFLAGFVVIVAIVHAGTGVAAVVKLFQIKLFSKITEALPLMIATLVLMAVNDIFITLVLCWYLRGAKSETRLGEIHSAIRTLMIYTIETGLLTSVTVTIDAICILTMPHNWIYIGITFCLSKRECVRSIGNSLQVLTTQGNWIDVVYVNSLLTILNSRKYLRNKESSIQKHSGSSRQSILVPSLRMDDLSGSGSSQKCPSSPFTPISQLKMEIPHRGIPPGLTTTTSTMVEPGYAI